MSGVIIIGELLRAHDPLTDAVPLAQIKAWKLKQGSPLPSLVVTRVSRATRVMLDGSTLKTVTDRVQVTARAADGVQREAVLQLAHDACSGKLGTIAGYDGVAVLSAGTGPDFEDDAASIFMGSVDFRVTFNQPA